MAKRYKEQQQGESSTTSYSTGISTGFTIGESKTITYTPGALRDTRLRLEWMLRDLESHLERDETVTARDLEWYLGRVQRIFDAALARRRGE